MRLKICACCKKHPVDWPNVNISVKTYKIAKMLEENGKKPISCIMKGSK